MSNKRFTATVDEPAEEHSVMVKGEQTLNKKTAGVFLLPNVLTTGNLCLGFYAILSTITDNLVVATSVIFIAAILDGLDGVVARAIHGQSRFGLEYDSLADMVSFGVAPAILTFHVLSEEGGRLAWAFAFIYVACAAMRLARFNTQTARHNNRSFFSGLPSPAAACTVAAFVLYGALPMEEIVWSPTANVWFFGTMVGVLGLLMLSTIPYASFRRAKEGPRTRSIRIMIILVLALLLLDFDRMAPVIAMFYVLSGPTLFAWRSLLRKPRVR